MNVPSIYLTAKRIDACYKTNALSNSGQALCTCLALPHTHASCPSTFGRVSLERILFKNVAAEGPICWA
jgi:hypothetical protein